MKCTSNRYTQKKVITVFAGALTLAFAISGCGGGGGGDTAPATTTTTPSALASVDGTWITNCVVDGATSYKNTLTNTNGTGSILQQTYSDTACITMSMQQEAGYTYTLGSAVTVNGSVAGITTATKLNTTFTSGISGSTFDIVAIKDTNTMYFGDDNGTNNGSTDALRPTQLDASEVYTKTTVDSGIGLGTGTGIPTSTGTAIISGRVTGETFNQPLQGAAVKVYYASDTDPANIAVFTDADGNYSLTVKENVDLSLQFSADTYATINSERGQIVGNVSGADLAMNTRTEVFVLLNQLGVQSEVLDYGWVLVNTEASDGSELLGVSIDASGKPADGFGGSWNNPIYVFCELYEALGQTVTSGGDFTNRDVTEPCVDDRPYMYVIAYGDPLVAPFTQNVTISTSFDSAIATVRTGEFTIVDLEQPAPTSTPSTTTAALTGTWKSPCFLDDDDQSNIFYSIVTATINASSIKLLTDEYRLPGTTVLDTTCTTLDTQITENYFYMLGSDVTVNGTVAGITTATKIDITSAAPPNEVGYDIVAVKDNKLYFGDETPAADGSSDAKRTTQLDGVDVLTKQ